MKKADKVYQQIVDLAEYINSKQKEGWLLIDEEGDVVKASFVFSSPFNEKCVAFRNSENGWGTIVVYGETYCNGEDTLLKEYQESLNYLKTNYKLWEPKQIHNL